MCILWSAAWSAAWLTKSVEVQRVWEVHDDRLQFLTVPDVFSA